MHSILQVPVSTPPALQTPAFLPPNHPQSDGSLQRTSRRSGPARVWLAQANISLSSQCWSPVRPEGAQRAAVGRQRSADLAVGRSQNPSGIVPDHVHQGRVPMSLSTEGGQQGHGWLSMTLVWSLCPLRIAPESGAKWWMHGPTGWVQRPCPAPWVHGPTGRVQRPCPAPWVHGVAPSYLWPCSSPSHLLQDIHSQGEAREDVAVLGSTRSKARARATLEDLLDTLKLLEEEPEPLPHPKAYHKDRYAWTDEVSKHWALTPPCRPGGTGHHVPATRARCAY